VLSVILIWRWLLYHILELVSDIYISSTVVNTMVYRTVETIDDSDITGRDDPSNFTFMNVISALSNIAYIELQGFDKAAAGDFGSRSNFFHGSELLLQVRGFALGSNGPVITKKRSLILHSGLPSRLPKQHYLLIADLSNALKTQFAFFVLRAPASRHSASIRHHEHQDRLSPSTSAGIFEIEAKALPVRRWWPKVA
jgi:hypothetical protein